jgi:hypothetical protein
MTVQNAIALLRANGYRVTKTKKPTVKDRVGPTFAAEFADGTLTRMSTFTSLAKLDIGRGVRLATAAWQSRQRHSALPPPAIVAAHFEQDGVRLANYTATQLELHT